MALMQLFPKFVASLECLDQGKVVPRARPPALLEYRSGGDTAGVVERVAASRCVAINAAPGAGKSTILPAALAEATGVLVFHVLPYAHLAAVTHAYVSGLPHGVSVSLVDEVKQPYPREGLCITSAAQVVARWLESGVVDMPRCYVLHDESHESGVASAALRAFAPTASGVLSYVTMSATADLGEARRMEAGGTVFDYTYDVDAFRDPWSVEEEGAPWSVDRVMGHILIFEDDKRRAQELMQAYNYNGFAAFRLHTGLSSKEVLSILARVNDSNNSAMCALIADSSFRSGYTFPVSVVVDSGKVRRTVCVDGKPEVRVRGIYEFERVQSRSRGGRLAGLNTEYWRPLGEVPNVLCDLEQADVEALALVCRFLGYRPVREAAAAVMASGPVPMELWSAFRGFMPLACLTADQLVDPEVCRKPPSGEGASGEEGAEPVSAGAVDDARPGRRAVAAVRHVRKDSGYGSPEPAGGPEETAEDVLNSLFSSLGVKKDKVELGQYCYVEGAVTGDAFSTAFPRGAESVHRVLAGDAGRDTHRVWDIHQRSVAVNALVHAHNVDLIQWRSWSAVLKAARQDALSKDASALRTWAIRCAEEVSRLAARVEHTLSLLQSVADDHLDVLPCEGVFAREEERLSGAMTASFQALPSRDAGRLAEESARVRQWASHASAQVEAARDRGRRVSSSVSSPGGDGGDAPSWLSVGGYTGHPRPQVGRLEFVRRRSRAGSGMVSGLEPGTYVRRRPPSGGAGTDSEVQSSW